MEVEARLDSIELEEAAEQRERLVADMEASGIDEQSVLQGARKNISDWEAYFQENIRRGEDDLRFVIRDQWDAAERAEFIRLFKPAMTFNKLRDVIRKVSGEQRKNKPDLMVRSLNGKASQDEINLRSDLVRSICYQSQNDLIYQQAFDSALKRGYGAWEVTIDYESQRSFNQVIRYEGIQDVRYTSFDPAAVKPHKGDGNFCARQFIYSKEQFLAEFPWVANPVSYVDPRTQINVNWETRDIILVCKYTCKEWFPLKIFQLDNGMVVTENEWLAMQESFRDLKFAADKAIVVKDMILSQIPQVRAERMTQDYKIRQYLLTHNEVIKFTDWPSKYLPIIFVDGDSNYIDGRQVTNSFIHDAKDAQKFINYVGSEIAAEIKNRRREQWIGTVDNIMGYEEIWRNPEQQNGILIAKPDKDTKMMPQKLPAWDLSPTLLQQFQRGSQDIREIIGFSEAEELQGRDISGKARRERKTEGSMSAYVYFDNLNQAIEQSGRVVLDLLPAVYGNDERYVSVKKQDGRTDSIVLNKQINGEVQNPITAGEYDIEIDTGPSFAVQKEVALEFFQQTIAANPQTFNLIADLWAKNLDVQFMPQIADRFKTLVPPQIVAKEEGKQLPPQPPSPQEIMMQQQMQMQQAEMAEKAKKIQIQEEELQLKKDKLELEKIEAAMKAQADMQKIQTEQSYQAMEAGKSQINYTTDLMKLAADLHKHHSKNG